MFCSLRGGATPRVVGVRAVLCESRMGQQHQAHDAAAVGATLRTKRPQGQRRKQIQAEGSRRGVRWGVDTTVLEESEV